MLKQIIMQSGEPQKVIIKDAEALRNMVIIDSVETQITHKMVFIFLKVNNKNIDQVKSFRKNGNKIYLQFKGNKQAQQFIDKHNHQSSILVRKFNAYLQLFQHEQLTERVEVTGATIDKLRVVYEYCKKYGPCKFHLQYSGNKLFHTFVIQFIKLEPQNLEELKKSLEGLKMNVRKQEVTGQFQQFRCSIQISNFHPISSLKLSQQEKEMLKDRLKIIVGKIAQEPLKGIQLDSFSLKGQSTVKAYFGFGNTDKTFQGFQKMRQKLISHQQMRCRLFYFKDEANSFRTLFVGKIINPKELTLQELQNQMVQSFRKINPLVTQIILKKKSDTYVGKIYMRDEDSGRDLVVDIYQNRSKIYQFFKPNSAIVLNIFQGKSEKRKKDKIQKNVYKMMGQMKKTQPQRLNQQPYPYPNQIQKEK